MNRTFSLFPNFRPFLHDIINPRLFLNASLAVNFDRFVVLYYRCLINIVNLYPAIPSCPAALFTTF